MNGEKLEDRPLVGEGIKPTDAMADSKGNAAQVSSWSWLIATSSTPQLTAGAASSHATAPQYFVRMSGLIQRPRVLDSLG